MNSTTAGLDAATSDPLDASPLPERVHYHTGVLLDRDDFRSEQTYHRGRLARLARYLHGVGTVAGLEVRYEPAAAPTPADAGHEERLVITPGLAVDRLGRQIELWERACIRLDAWLAWHCGQAGRRARLNGSIWPSDAAVPAAVVADVFLAFRPCAHGRTPAFATGAYDALDATVPARVRDAWLIELVPRDERSAADPALRPPLPAPVLPDPAAFADDAARLAALRKHKLQHAWSEPQLRRTDGDGLVLEPEHVRGLHRGDELFLARVVIPVQRAEGDDPDPSAPGGATAILTTRTVAAPVIDNDSRRLCFATAELAWLTAGVR
jgi:hypothetical protein